MNIILARLLKLFGLYNEEYRHFKGFEFSKYYYKTNKEIKSDITIEDAKIIDIYYRGLDAYMIDENQFKINLKIQLAKGAVGGMVMYKGEGIAVSIIEKEKEVYATTISRGTRITYLDIKFLENIANNKIQDETKKHLDSFTDDYEEWIELIKDSKNSKNILSEEFSIYQDTYYSTFKEDGMMAYLFTRSFEKGYLCAEYIINQDKYLNHNSIDKNTNESFFNATATVAELEEKGENLLAILDDFFYELVENDSGSYEGNIAEEYREDIWEFSKKQMILGILTRLTELKLLYKLNGNDNVLTGIKMSKEKYSELSFQKTSEYLKS